MIKRRVSAEANVDIVSADNIKDNINTDNDEYKSLELNGKSFMHSCMLVFACVLYIALSFFLRIFVYDINTVSGSSMYPTLSDKDVLITETGVLNDLQRFDIVTIDVHDEYKGDIRIIKRIIGLPGELVTVYTNGYVAINNEFLDDEYQIDCDSFESDNISYEVMLGDDEYFVLGDNRCNSADSRVYGAFSIDDIKGKVIYRVFPFNVSGKLSDIKMMD